MDFGTLYSIVHTLDWAETIAFCGFFISLFCVVRALSTKWEKTSSAYSSNFPSKQDLLNPVFRTQPYLLSMKLHSQFSNEDFVPLSDDPNTFLCYKYHKCDFNLKLKHKIKNLFGKENSSLENSPDENHAKNKIDKAWRIDFIISYFWKLLALLQINISSNKNEHFF